MVEWLVGRPRTQSDWGLFFYMVMTEQEADREWTQRELREYLVSIGIADIGEDEILPQGVKYLAKPGPLTKADLDSAGRLLAEGIITGV